MQNVATMNQLHICVTKRHGPMYKTGLNHNSVGEPTKNFRDKIRPTKTQKQIQEFTLEMTKSQITKINLHIIPNTSYSCTRYNMIDMSYFTFDVRRKNFDQQLSPVGSITCT